MSRPAVGWVASVGGYLDSHAREGWARPLAVVPAVRWGEEADRDHRRPGPDPMGAAGCGRPVTCLARVHGVTGDRWQPRITTSNPLASRQLPGWPDDPVQALTRGCNRSEPPRAVPSQASRLLAQRAYRPSTADSGLDDHVAVFGESPATRHGLPPSPVAHRTSPVKLRRKSSRACVRADVRPARPRPGDHHCDGPCRAGLWFAPTGSATVRWSS